MWNLNNETIVRIVTALAVVVAAIVGGILGFFAQWKTKQLEASLEKKKNKETQRLQFYIPLLRNLYELDDRFDRIFKNLNTDWLNQEHLIKIKNKQGFADNPNNTGYFIISSIYLIASFFGLTDSIKRGVDTTKFSREKKGIKKLWKKLKIKIKSLLGYKPKLNIFQFDPDITKVCRLFQYEEFFSKYLMNSSMQFPKDACKLHKHIQHSIGEMMLEKAKDEIYRIKSFREFYEAYVSDEKFRFWFVLIENLFIDLSNFPSEKSLEAKVEIKNDVRPLRILAIQYWCRELMQRISLELDLAELNLQTRPPRDILADVSENLKNIITSYTLDNVETYLLGFKVNKE